MTLTRALPIALLAAAVAAWSCGKPNAGDSPLDQDAAIPDGADAGFDPAAQSYFSVWGSASNDVWAVGNKGAMVHWNGSEWTHVPLGANRDLARVWGTAADDVWAVGGFGTVFHWDGAAWSSRAPGEAVEVVDPATEQPGAVNIVAIWGTGPQNVWLAGYSGVIVRWDGEKYVKEESGVTNAITSLWGNATNDVWAVGTAGTILHRDGNAWSQVASGTIKDLHSVWGTGPDDMWACGADGVIVHWDGTDWSASKSGVDSWLWGLWGFSNTDVRAVGAQATMLHYDGRGWKPAAIPTRASITSIWGLSPTDLWLTTVNPGGLPIHLAD